MAKKLTEEDKKSLAATKDFKNLSEKSKQYVLGLMKGLELAKK